MEYVIASSPTRDRPTRAGSTPCSGRPGCGSAAGRRRRLGGALTRPPPPGRDPHPRTRPCPRPPSATARLGRDYHESTESTRITSRIIARGGSTVLTEFLWATTPIGTEGTASRVLADHTGRRTVGGGRLESDVRHALRGHPVLFDEGDEAAPNSRVVIDWISLNLPVCSRRRSARRAKSTPAVGEGTAISPGTRQRSRRRPPMPR
jgi:hypothetical protein